MVRPLLGSQFHHNEVNSGPRGRANNWFAKIRDAIYSRGIYKDVDKDTIGVLEIQVRVIPDKDA